MPYIITTTDPQHVCQSTPDRCQVEPIVSRHAVATLEDMIGVVRKEIVSFTPAYGTSHERVWRELDNLSEAGGTIGPLPDGTCISVEWVDD